MPDHLFPKITVVTPNYNQDHFLEKTICSVLEQNYPNLEYIIIDGGSTDSSLEIIKKYQNRLHYWVSEKDKGMYDAINKGFFHSTGDIMCWINSDDVLWKGSLDYVAKTFSKNHKIHWLQGFPSVIDEQGEIIYQREHVFSKFFFYLKKYEKSFAFIQQESTFWSRKLWEKAGAKMDLSYTVASDFDLWMRFFHFETLYCTNHQLAAFRKRQNQQSSNQTLYVEESNRSIDQHTKELHLFEKILLLAANVIQSICLRSKLSILIYFSNKMDSLLIGKPKFV